MMQNSLLIYIWIFPAAYLLGSVPTAVWVGKWFHGIDIREHGSKNAGATNVMRVLGAASGIPVLVVDMLKGWAAVMLIHLQHGIAEGTPGWTLVSLILGILAVAGHIFPVFAGFRGGKGVATITGVCFALHPLATLSSLGVFIVVLLISKYVSASSVSAGLSFPLWVMVIYEAPGIILSVFSVVAALLLFYTHRSNIRRLLNGTENKAGFLTRKKSL